MKKRNFFLLITVIFILASTSQVLAQSSGELQLGLNRIFGYGGFGNQIQGTFTILIKNPPDNLARVEFFIDNTSMGEVSQKPFSLQFTTDSYALGNHTFHAIGYTTSGQQINSNQITAEFVSASIGGQSVLKIIVPILAVLALALVITFAVPTFMNKGKFSSMPLGTARKYGVGGGAICPKCKRPFPLRLWMVNLGPWKIDRCPFCGKWSFVHVSSVAELRAAEEAELTQAQAGTPIAGESEAEKLNKEIDDSRYQDM